MKRSGAAFEGNTPSQLLFAIFSVTVLGVVLLITPGWTLFYDVTPKVVMLLAGTAAALLLFPFWTAGLNALWRDSLGRAFLSLLAIQLLSLLVSTALSTQPGISYAGSNWRRFGLVTHGATMLFVLAFASYLTAERRQLRALLRVFAIGTFAAAAYGVLQYFGIDPLVPGEAYHFGEAEHSIVRTPGTLGHAGYFATYLSGAVCWAFALARCEQGRAWRLFAFSTAGLGAFAIVLSGTRGAIVGLLAAGAIALIWQGLRISRRTLTAALLAVCALSAFYFSPWGDKLRGRTRWYVEDAYGGGRLLLWRDSLRMFAAGPWIQGAGLETYSAEFPVFLSPELAKAYPNRYHESPHNVFLDALTSQGLLGLLFVAGVTVAAIIAAWRLRKRGSPTGMWLAAAFGAAFASNQFLALTLPTALGFYLGAALLVAASGPVSTSEPAAPAPRWSWLAASTVALFLCFFGVRLAAADAMLANVRRHAGPGSITAVIQEYERVRRVEPWGMNADLWYSRWMMEAAQRTPAPAERLAAWQAALTAGQRAAEEAGERQIACYNLALIHGLRNGAPSAEAALRRTIEVAPAWYKPRWVLAQLLWYTGRLEEAKREAELAHELNGGEDPQVTATLERLRGGTGLSGR